MAKRPLRSNPQASTVRHIRIFVASPGDVSQERQLTRTIVERLGKDPAFQDRLKLNPILWDDPEAPAPMLANLTPQESVSRGLVRPSDCEIVVAIFWARMGTPLEKPLKKGKTPYLSGTEWEFEDARRGRRDILLYRRMAKAVADLDDPALEEKRAQKKLVNHFFERLKGPHGGWLGGHATYEEPEDFSRLLEANLRNLLTKLLAAPTRAGGLRPKIPDLERTARDGTYDQVTGSFSGPRPKERVGRTIQCAGVVSGMRPGLSLWLAVEVGDVVWPKEATVLPDRNHKWRATIFEDGATKQFSVSLLVADTKADKRLKKWLEAGRRTGRYTEMRGIPGTRRLARVDGLRLKR